MFTLRPYQEQFIDDIRHEFAIGKRRVCAVAPCGSGKTVMAGWMARGALVRGRRVLFMVHRKELIEQTSRAFQRLGINHSLILKGARVVDDSPVHIASVQTLSRRLDKLQPPDFLICDECHHIMAGTYQKILTAFPKAYVLGLTATPTRLNGSGLGSVFESLVLGATVKELIAEGNLAPYDYYAPPTKFDPKLARVRYGEYVKSDVAAQIDDAMIIGDVVKNYKKYADGKRAIVYCISREHSEHIAAAFQKEGIAACHVDGDTASARRANCIAAFREGKINVLCNCELFGEGFDVPALDAVILARPTKSLTLYIQQAMRAMRRDDHNPKKRAVIIDHVGNVFQHGLPDEEREWTLEEKAKRKRMREVPPIRQCPKCFAALPAQAKVCSSCGYVFRTEGRKATESDGQLVRIEELKRKKRQEVGRARTIQELEAIAIRRGYSMRWVTHIARARHRKG